MRLLLSTTFLCALCDAFIPRGIDKQRVTTIITPITFIPRSVDQNFLDGFLHHLAVRTPYVVYDPPLITLFAKKKKGNSNAAALEALDALEEKFDLNEPLSKKDQKQLLKNQKKNVAKVDAQHEEGGAINSNNKQMSKKEKMLAKALALEALDAESNSSSTNGDDDKPRLSKKELKALKKKEEKMAAKAKK